ncbi:MAG TPA: 50S ribosomal protein L4 [Candidatus Saccharimonadales bacterium]|nr:50S ribosomal protein L4 [Candidatus Saccharimonadales bacterium]
MAVATYTKSGAKATAPAKLDKAVFGVEIKDHQLLKDAYLAYMANGRTNNALTKRRGQVSGGGRKPWRQKGTGNARVGSSRTPLWRGGGIIFGPTGQENYSRQLSLTAKRQALRQALTVASKENRIKVIDDFNFSDGKVKPVISLLGKIEAAGNTLLVVSEKNNLTDRATRNLPNIKAVQARYLNVFDIMNADSIVISKEALDMVHEWLGGAK